PWDSITTANRSNRRMRPSMRLPVIISRVTARASFRLWKRNPSWMLMFGLFMPALASFLQLPSAPRRELRRVPRVAPLHVRLAPEPGLLAFRVAARGDHDPPERFPLVELAGEMPHPLRVSDGLERRRLPRNPFGQQPPDLVEPAGVAH